MKTSTVKQLGSVTLPEFTGDRIYMREFRKADGLPSDLSRWQPTVDQMLDGVDSDGPIFIMVDQTELKAGTPQRRPGVHIDGVWHAGHGWDNQGGGQWNLGSHDTGGHRFQDGVETQSLILASNVEGCAVYEGQYDGQPGDGGDFTHLELSGLRRVILEPNHAYAGDAMQLLHESIPVVRDCRRMLVRLNVSNWLPS